MKITLSLILSGLGTFSALSAPGFMDIGTPGNGSNSGGSGSFAPAFSADGRSVVFVSQANNLVTNDNLAPFLDVFFRDLLTGETSLVSVNTNGVGGGDEDSNYPSISANGRYVAFASAAGNLSADDTNAAVDIFVRDITAGTTTLASVSLSGKSGFGKTPRNVALNGRPQISANGRKVVFESGASDLISDDVNNLQDIFLRDLDTGLTTLVSVGAYLGESPTPPPAERSHSPSMTPDANRIAFVSTALNLFTATPAITNRMGEVYVRDVAAGTTFWASRFATNAFAGMNLNVESYGCFSPTIAANGRFVAYKTTNSSSFLNPRGVAVVLHDLQLGHSSILTTNSLADTQLSLSADGRFVAYEVATLTATNLRVFDQESLTSVLANDPGDNRRSFAPALTPDGSKIAFISSATNLVSEVTNGLHQAYVRDLVAGTTKLGSPDMDGRPSSDLQFVVPAISSDGLRVAFDSDNEQLIIRDRNRASDVFVRDLVSDTTRMVSERHPDLSPQSGASRSTLARRSLGGNGLGVWLAFVSTDLHSYGRDTNGLEDVFARNLTGQVTIPVSATSSGPDAGFSTVAPGRSPFLSDNGRYVAFIWAEQSGAMFPSKTALFRKDLMTGENVMVAATVGRLPNSFSSLGPFSYPISLSANGNRLVFQIEESGRSQIYLRDFTLPTNTLISINRFGTAGGNAASVDPIVSSDGRWILFASLATDLTTDNTGGLLSLFVHDLSSSTTRLLSTGIKGHITQGLASRVSWTTDSRQVSFTTRTNTVLLCDLVTGVAKELCASCDNASLDAEARYAAYQTLAVGSAPLSGNIVLKDVPNGVINQITMDYFGPGSGTSIQPLLTPNGRYVIFTSKATNLVENDFNNRSDIFLYDRLLTTTLLISRNITGSGSGNEVSSLPQLSSNGRILAFSSLASDLINGDYNDQRDIFVVYLSTGDTDADGLDDDWEVAYFGNLSRNGSGDFDQDGSTDAQEFAAGTDPANSNSILRVITIERVGANGLTIVWSSISGRTYQVQYKEDLSVSGWSNLGGSVRATASSTSISDAGVTSREHRFYRVLIAP